MTRRELVKLGFAASAASLAIPRAFATFTNPGPMKLPARISLAQFPTPLRKLSRLSKVLGGPEIYIKHDDEAGLASGGNKIRKLEFLFAAAHAAGADHIITMGGPQSNHARQTAAVAAKLGLDCSLCLRGHKPATRVGNLLLDDLLGAKVYFAGDRTREEIAQELVIKLQNEGKKPFLIPVGGSTGLGAIGYVLAMQEALDQLKEKNLQVGTMVVASSSGGTQAGLALGAALFGYRGKVLGMSIDESVESLTRIVTRLVNAAGEILDEEPSAASTRVHVNADYLGGGYAVVGDLEREAIRLVARAEGLLLDPVYTGRAMGGLIDQIRKGVYSKTDKILFWHTGGAAALSAFADKLT